MDFDDETCLTGHAGNIINSIPINLARCNEQINHYSRVRCVYLLLCRRPTIASSSGTARCLLHYKTNDTNRYARSPFTPTSAHAERDENQRKMSKWRKSKECFSSTQSSGGGGGGDYTLRLVCENNKQKAKGFSKITAARGGTIALLHNNTDARSAYLKYHAVPITIVYPHIVCVLLSCCTAYGVHLVGLCARSPYSLPWKSSREKWSPYFP